MPKERLIDQVDPLCILYGSDDNGTELDELITMLADESLEELKRRIESK